MAMFEWNTTIRDEMITPSALRPAATVDRLGRPCHLQPTGRRWARQNDITNIRPISASLHQAALKPNGRYRNYMVAAVAPLHRA